MCKLVCLSLHHRKHVCRFLIVCFRILLAQELSIGFETGDRRLEFMAGDSQKRIFVPLQFPALRDIFKRQKNEWLSAFDAWNAASIEQEDLVSNGGKHVVYLEILEAMLFRKDLL